MAVHSCPAMTARPCGFPVDPMRPSCSQRSQSALPRRIGLRLALAGFALPELFNELAFLVGVMVYGF